MLGLKHGVNLLVDYDPTWPAGFEAEAQRIQSALRDLALGIEHYGSTSVVGLRAKPIIDILVGVQPIENWTHCRTPLEMLGYDYAEHAGVPGNYIFGRGRDRSERTHLIHIVEYEGAVWRACLAFRDALRADSVLAAQYVALKENAIVLAPEGRAAYTDLKRDFVEGVVISRSRPQAHQAHDARAGRAGGRPPGL